jgi:hypothetical protein
MVDEPAGWRCRVAVSNDTLEDAEGRYSVTDAETGEELLGGAYEAPANATTALGAIPVSHGEHRLFLIRWDAGGREYGSHYFLGKPPFSLDWYRERLRDIASLPEGFDPEAVAR